MSQLVRLSNVVALEILDPKAFTPIQKELYIYKFDSDKHLHILNQDASTNSRDTSVEPYFQFVLLKPTPSFYFGDQFHTDAKFNLTHALSYLDCRLHLADGYSYDPSTTYGVYVRLYFRTTTKEITLISFIDTYNNSKIQSNTRQLFLEGVGFSQSIPFQVLDVDELLNNPSMSDVKDEIIGAGESVASEILVDFAFIENDQIVNFTQGSDVFQRYYPGSIHSASVAKSDDQAELIVDFKYDEDNKILRFKLDHSKYNLQSYLSKYVAGNEELTINYDVSLEFYDSDDNIVGNTSTQFVNLVDPFGEIQFKPYVPENYDHVLIECRATIINVNTGLRISRYANILVPSPQLAFGQIPFTLNLSETKPIHKLNITSRPIVSPNEMPRLVEIHKPIYVTTAQNDIIVLHPVESNVRILLSDVDTRSSRSLQMTIGNRLYNPVERTRDYVTFTIPSTEFYNDATSWYIIDETSQMVTFGRLARFTGEL